MKPNERARKIADDWNTTVRPGADVVVSLDGGAEVETKTRSEAWVLGGRGAVVLLEGRPGGYLLSRVRVKA